jgi:hypothetical protein
VGVRPGTPGDIALDTGKWHHYTMRRVHKINSVTEILVTMATRWSRSLLLRSAACDESNCTFTGK